MPELPEVETIKRALSQMLKGQPKILKVESSGLRLRKPLPRNFKKKLVKAQVLGFQRRAKYLIWQTTGGDFISHLGMTGTWRCEPLNFQKRKHDHIVIYFSKQVLIYNDPRRFGWVEWGGVDSPIFSELGPEPFLESFCKEEFLLKSQKGTAPIKSWIMNPKVVVGVGNIYANEALFRARLSPLKPVGQIRPQRLLQLREHIIKVIQEAILAGGSSIQDYVQPGGSQGHFQMGFQVYGREDQPCRECERPIRRQVIAGRSSFYCPRCQKS